MSLALVAALGAGACQQAAEAPAAPAAASAAVPSQTMQETFANCTWGEVTGSGLSVWSYACGSGSGNTRLVADDSLPGFAIEGTYEGETSRRPAIVIFKKAADAPIESILEAVRSKSPGPNSANCTLQPVTFEGAVPGSFAFEPTGAIKTAWEAFASGAADAGPVEAPCGDMGPQMSGDRSFRVVEGDPTTVVLIEYGSEIQIFDPSTIKPAA
jgi:hypothetical protein